MKVGKAGNPAYHQLDVTSSDRIMEGQSLIIHNVPWFRSSQLPSLGTALMRFSLYWSMSSGLTTRSLVSQQLL